MSFTFKNDNSLLLKLIVLLLLQMVITDYVNLGPFIYVNLLPIIILAMPTSMPVTLLLLSAFVSGCLVDGLAEGIWGLNAFSAVMAAAVKNFFISSLADREIVQRGLPLDIRKYGFASILMIIAGMTTVFFLSYCITDMFSHRPFWFILVKVICSSLISTIICTLAFEPIFSDRHNR